MYKIVVTKDFINALYNIPMQYFFALIRTLVKIERIPCINEEEPTVSNCIDELIEQLRNQELE